MIPFIERGAVALVFATLVVGVSSAATAQERPAAENVDRTQRTEDLEARRALRLENARKERAELLSEREAMRKDPEYRKRVAAERAEKRKKRPRREAQPSRKSLHNLQRKVAIAENRHNQMLARMAVIREFAEAAGDTESIAKVDALLVLENDQWENEQARMNQRLERRKPNRESRRERPVNRPNSDARPERRERPVERTARPEETR